MKFPLLPLLLGSAVMVSSAWAQTPNNSASQIQSGTQPGSPSNTLGNPSAISSIPELYPGEASDFGTQRVVKEKVSRKWVELDLDYQHSYTNNYLSAEAVNVSGVDNGRVATSVQVSTLDAAFAPDPFDWRGLKIFPRVGFRQSWWNYGLLTNRLSDFNNFDFETQSFYGETKVAFPGDWSATVGADWTRIVSREGVDEYNEIYKQVGPRWGVSKTFTINDYNAVIVGLDQQYLFTEVDALTGGAAGIVLNDNIYDRLNTTLGLSYVWSPVDRLFVTPYYRLTHTYYPGYAVAGIGQQQNEDRTDFTNTVGLVTAYQINDFLTARVFLSYETKTTTYENPNDTTNANVPEYTKFDAGLGGAFSIRF